MLNESHTSLFISTLHWYQKFAASRYQTFAASSELLTFVFFFGAPFCLICAYAFPCSFFFHSSELSLKVVFVFSQREQLDFLILAVGSVALVCLLVSIVPPLVCFLRYLKFGKGGLVFAGLIYPVFFVLLELRVCGFELSNFSFKCLFLFLQLAHFNSLGI